MKFRIQRRPVVIRFPAWYIPAAFLLLYVSYLIVRR